MKLGIRAKLFAVSLLNFYLRPRRQEQLAVRDYGFAGRNSFINHRFAFHGFTCGHGAEVGGRIRLHDKDVLARLARLHGLRWHHSGVMLHAQPHDDIDKLSRPEAIIGVLKRGAHFDGAGGNVHGVVNEGELAQSRRPRIVGNVRLDHQRPARLVFSHLRQGIAPARRTSRRSGAPD